VRLSVNQNTDVPSKRRALIASDMSAFGPKRTSLVAPHMSAFGGKADIRVKADIVA